MKLNPPASSSDLEVARAIARRLHRRARGTEGTPDVEPPEALSPSAAPAPAAAPRAPRAAPFPPPKLQPEPPAAEPEPPELEPEPPELEPLPPELEPLPPGGYTTDPGPVAPPAPDESESLFEPEPPGGYTTDTGPGGPEAPAPPEPFEPEPPGGYVADTGSFSPEGPTPATGAPEEPLLEGAGGDLGLGPSEADDALSALTGPAEESALDGLEAPGEAGVSPEDLIADEPAPIEAELAAPAREPTTAEDLVEVSAPSWDDVADSCLALAPAHGAMLVDPAGQVLAARGDWPEPGPEAIAGRLVSMMEKKLQDSPTRSVSAPLAGQHLTAWRVPAEQGYLTVVFMAPVPLRADVRPSIDATIQASAG